MLTPPYLPLRLPTFPVTSFELAAPAPIIDASYRQIFGPHCRVTQRGDGNTQNEAFKKTFKGDYLGRRNTNNKAYSLLLPDFTYFKYALHRSSISPSLQSFSCILLRFTFFIAPTESKEKPDLAIAVTSHKERP